MERYARGILYGLTFLVPIFFLPVVLDPLEIAKQTLLLIGVLLALLLWMGSMAAKKTFHMRGGFLQGLPLVLLACYVISAARSQGPYVSFVGTSSQAYASVATLSALVVFYYLCVNLLNTEAFRVQAGSWLVASGAIVSWLGTLALYGVHVIPRSVAAFDAFNTVGTLNAFGIAVAALCVFACGMWARAKKKPGILFIVSAVALWSGALLALIAIDFWMIWVVLLVGLATILLVTFLRPSADGSPLRYIPTALCLAVAVLYLSVLPSPVARTIPVEVTLDFPASWQIAQQSLGETSWLFGSGPGTYAFRYAEDHTADVNATLFWNTRFDRASSQALTLLPTVGILGMGLWVLFFCGLLFQGGQSLETPLEGLALCTCLFVASFLYPSNITLQFLLFAGAGFLGASHVSEKAWGFKKPKEASFATHAGFVTLAIVIMTVAFMSGQRLYAEAAYAQAVRGERVGDKTEQTVEVLSRAATVNRFDDAYQRALAQALLARLGDEIQPETQEIKEGEQPYALAVATAATNAARTATEQAPHDALNWLTRGLVSRELMPLIVNAGDDAIHAYQEAIALEPNNPADQTELGKTYLASAADAWRLASAETDEAAKGKAEEGITQMLANAEQAFNQAITLKPDYAPAHFQLALVYEQHGRLNDAIGKMESVSRYNPLDVGVAFQLGLLYLRRAGEGDQERAQSQFTHAIELAPSYSNAHWFLATIYEQKNDIPSAIHEVETVLALDPKNPIVQARLNRLNAGTTEGAIPEAIP